MGALGWPGHVWAYTVQAGPDSERVLYPVGTYQTNAGMPPVYAWMGPSEIEVPTTFTVTGLHLGAKREAQPPSDRQTMDFSDMVASHTWLADPETLMTASGAGVSATLDMGYTGGEEVVIGSSFWATYALQTTSMPQAGFVYAKIGNPSWG
jgi:hypothetical protein